MGNLNALAQKTLENNNNNQTYKPFINQFKSSIYLDRNPADIWLLKHINSNLTQVTVGFYTE